MVSMAQIHCEDRKRTRVTYKPVERAGKLYDQANYLIDNWVLLGMANYLDTVKMNLYTKRSLFSHTTTNIFLIKI